MNVASPLLKLKKTNDFIEKNILKYNNTGSSLSQKLSVLER